ncbi:LacI family transcriptional regulator [Planococcus maritimus]|uniref:LacI family DNA-binding transcriptional regulator n=1 Tax=Planococcus maritimus TaxID=192421 RepID=UPI00084C0956|nr:LacI family DNA-binding transcriptional regulator [Planococcus maritimus]OED32380.1 LacI family transcriptional regulator [Planococcus maritimus]
MANIKDVAQMAGVSVATVSRVLNHHPYVSEDKKAAVLRAMEQANYNRNINAVHLSKGQTNLIGVVVPTSNHPYFGLLIEGIANEALRQNYKLVLFQTNYETDRELEALAMLKDKQIDALIICSRISPWHLIEEYLSYGPIVVCENTRGTNVSSTFVDHYGSFFQALEYLHSKGYRKIGYCLGREMGANSDLRRTAYQDFLQKYKLAFNPNFVFYNCFNFEDGEHVLNRITEMESPPAALLISSDQVAAGILTCCKERDMAVPDQLALLGFDNQPIAKIMNITTLEIPLIEIGRKLFAQAIKEGISSQEEIAVKLIERQTV